MKINLMKATKECLNCKRELPLHRFYGDPECRLGRKPQCKECTSVLRLPWREDNREENRHRTAKWRVENPDKVIEYKEEHKEDLSVYLKKRRKENPGKVSAIAAASFQRRKDRIRIKNKKRMASDPYFRFCCNARSRYGMVLQNMVNGKKVGSAR